MDIDFLRNAVIVVNTIGMAVISLVVWLRKPGEDASKAVHALRADLTEQHNGLNVRLGKLEERIEHMPSSTELAELEGSVKEIKAQNNAQSERLNSISASVARIENFLLSNR